MRDFRFSNNHTPSAINGAMGLLEAPRLWVPETDYPDYRYWLQKVEGQLGHEKRAMMAYWGKQPVGIVMYQRHETEPGTVEIKNISVSPEARGRHVASFALRNAEIEAIQYDFPGCNRLVVDTKITNSGMIAFLTEQGYTPIAVTDLYGLKAGEDIVFEKFVIPASGFGIAE